MVFNFLYFDLNIIFVEKRLKGFFLLQDLMDDTKRKKNILITL